MTANIKCFICMAEKNILHLFDTYNCEGMDEVYSEMIYKCFGIEMVPHTGLTAMCMDCILKLRNAYYFKKALLKTICLLRNKKTKEQINSDSERLEYSPWDEEIICTSGNPNNNTSDDETSNIGNTNMVNDEEISNTYVIPNEGVKRKTKIATNYQIQNAKATTPIKPKRRRTTKSPDGPFTLEPDQTVCKLCDAECHTTKTLHSHMSTHYPNYVCEVCGKEFAIRRSFMKHKMCHKYGPFYCKVCNKEFSKLNSRAAHMRLAHSGDKALFSCQLCGEGFRTFVKRLRHLINVHDSVEAKYPCPFCPRKFYYAGSRSQHVSRTHLKERKYECAQCTMSFVKKAGLQSHLVTVHGIGEKKYVCSKCDKRFASNSGYTNHMETHEKENKRHIERQCPFCDETFLFAASFTRHLNNNHNGEA